MIFSPIYLEETDSTNTFCKSLALQGAPEGTAVIAYSQSAGRGRLGRTFQSPKGKGLYCSVLLRESVKPSVIPFITPCAAVAASKAIDTASGMKSGIKWVNDIFLGRKKVCGILTEARLPDYIIIGIGINLLSVKSTFPPELLKTASSIEDEAGVRLTPKEMAEILLPILGEELENAQSQRFIEAYSSRSILTGKQVTVCDGNRSYSAEVLCIDNQCRLTVKTQEGQVITLSGGDVSIKL